MTYMVVGAVVSAAVAIVAVLYSEHREAKHEEILRKRFIKIKAKWLERSEEMVLMDIDLKTFTHMMGLKLTDEEFYKLANEDNNNKK